MNSQIASSFGKGQPPTISVVVPVKNEAESLKLLILEICQVMRGVKLFEIIYIDDGSEDDTLERLRILINEVQELRVYRHETCCGQSAAILTGVKMARASVITTLDGDGQNDPADIPNLLTKYFASERPEFTLVVGHRTKRQDSYVRKISSFVANSIRASLLGDKTPDSGCGLKVFSKNTFLRIPNFDHMHRFLPALMIRLGGKVISVPVNHRYREYGKSKYGTWLRLWVGIIDVFGVIWLKRRGSMPRVSSLEDLGE